MNVIKKYSEIGDRLKQLRGKLSQQEFAKKIEIPFRTYQRYEAGERVPPSPLISTISEITQTTADWILTGKGWSFIPSTSLQAIQWIKKQVDRSNIKRVVIITYSDNKFGFAKGFLLETKDGILTMEGGSTRSGYTGGGPTTFKEILQLLNEKGIPIDGLEYEMDGSTLPLSQIDLFTLLSRPFIKRNVVDIELKTLSGAPSAAEGQNVDWTFPVVVRVTDLSGLSEDEAIKEITKMEIQYNSANPNRRIHILFRGKLD